MPVLKRSTLSLRFTGAIDSFPSCITFKFCRVKMIDAAENTKKRANVTHIKESRQVWVFILPKFVWPNLFRPAAFSASFQSKLRSPPRLNNRSGMPANLTAASPRHANLPPALPPTVDARPRKPFLTSTRPPMKSTLRSLCLLALAATLRAAAPATTAFIDVSVLPMDTERVLAHQTVLVTGDRIVQVGPAATVKIPADAQRIDGAGKFLIPGLGEMHGHNPPLGSSQAYIEQVYFLFVANGVTTVRGMLGWPGQLELRDQVKAGAITGPTLYLAGPSFTGNGAAAVRLPSAAEARVRQQKAEGWDLLEVHPGLTREVYDATWPKPPTRSGSVSPATSLPTSASPTRWSAARKPSTTSTATSNTSAPTPHPSIPPSSPPS